MLAEHKKNSCTSELDRKLQAKEARLPKGIRKYIRRLKQEGLWDEKVKYRIHQQRNNKHEIATDAIHETLVEVICTEDPVEEAAGQIKIIWLMNAVGIIETTEERKKQILEILDSQPIEIQPQVEALMPSIMREVQPLLPTAV
jgi:hypothetical protein